MARRVLQRSWSDSQPANGTSSVPKRDVEQVAKLALQAEGNRAWEALMGMHREGRSFDALLFGLLAPAAERIDEWWREDECTSFEATVAICNLRTVALRLVSTLACDCLHEDGRRAALLTPYGDRLTFGPVLHECYLEAAGWKVDKLEGLGTAVVFDYIQQTPIDLALCCVSERRLLERACRCLRRIPRISRNPSIRVVGFGHGFDASGTWPVDQIVQGPNELLRYLSV